MLFSWRGVLPCVQARTPCRQRRARGRRKGYIGIHGQLRGTQNPHMPSFISSTSCSMYLQEHVKSPIHIHNRSYVSHLGAPAAAPSSSTVRPAPGRGSSSQYYFDLTDSPPRHTQADFHLNSRSNSRAQHVVDLSDSPRRVPNSNAIASSSHGAPSQDMDLDYLLALRLNEELNGPQGHIDFEPHPAQEQHRYGAEIRAPNRNSENGITPATSSSMSQVHDRVDRHMSSSSTLRSDELEEHFPFEEPYHAQLRSIILSAPGERVQSYSLYRESKLFYYSAQTYL